MKHYIIDLQGNLLEVTDLQEAVFQVAMYLNYLYHDNAQEHAVFVLRHILYWKDIYTKLNQLRVKQALTA